MSENYTHPLRGRRLPEVPNDYPIYCKNDGCKYKWLEAFHIYDEQSGVREQSVAWVCPLCYEQYGQWFDY